MTSPSSPAISSIDRKAVVARHRIEIRAFDRLSPLSVGNGEFAFTADVTGLQTFPEAYESDIPLCTQSQWGWHRFPMPAELVGQRLRATEVDTYGRGVGYHVHKKGQERLFDHLRQSPHRLHLGRIGLLLLAQDGRRATLGDISPIEQSLDMWSGLLRSRFAFEGQPVEVETCCCGDRLDGVAVRVRSPLVASGQVGILLAFPYGSPEVNAADWSQPNAHETIVTRPAEGRVNLVRQLDADRYHVAAAWSSPARWESGEPHHFTIAAADSDQIECVVAFGQDALPLALPSTKEAQADSARFWNDYWMSGAAVDFEGSADPRAPELERRVVASQYLMRLNCAGTLPPAETGVTCNSWYGKFHLEMHWWHGVHFALWGRLPLLERSLGYYHRVLSEARRIAARQGYAGARWPKMVGPDGVDSPSPVGPLLIWQQPHPIYYAELIYRERPTSQTLENWGDVVEETAEFMASYAHLESAENRYVLGPPLKTVSENTDPMTSRNPAFELVYWRWGLRVAQQWRERRGLPRNESWDTILERLPPLAEQDGLYLMQEGMTATYTEWNWEHPALVGTRGMLAGDGVDPATHRRTVEKVMQVWQWDRCWGWDFPMVAMAAARAGRGDLAVDALFVESKKNTYSKGGHNYQRPGLALYLPGNGGLLAAVAMMAAGWDGAPDLPTPGFPTEGWTVRWEGLRRMP